MGIYIKENQECAYLYLCGIRPLREVALGDGVTLLPAVSNPYPEDMIDSNFVRRIRHWPMSLADSGRI